MSHRLFQRLKNSAHWPEARFWPLFVCFFLLATLLFLRSPSTNFVYDEQEALLGNPYLAGEHAWTEVLRVDFWGRAPQATIGSYRPVPNLFWRCLAPSLALRTPWFFGWWNLLFHALTGTLLSLSVRRLLAGQGESLRSPIAWMTGAFFVSAALSTEAVSGIVGLADVLVAFFTILGLYSLLVLRSSLLVFALFGCALFGTLSKETMLCSLPFLTLAPLVLALTAQKPRMKGCRGATGRALFRTLLSGVGLSLGLISAVLLRRSFFPARPAKTEALVTEGFWARALTSFLEWLSPPIMPADPMNNPLLEADTGERFSTASSVLLKNLGQLLFPHNLVSEYSFPRQLVEGWNVMAVGGASLVLVLLAITLRSLVRGLKARRESSSVMLLGLGSALFVLSVLPVSNALLLLPTIRAERLFYTPSLGVAFVLAGLLLWGLRSALFQRASWVGFFALLCFQMLQARRHSLHYSSDLTFWKNAASGEPPSAKAFLNLGVMVGARGDQEARLHSTQRATRLAPEWPMGQIYLADTYCRLGRLDDAMPHYFRGLALIPESKALTSLALQCIWDAGVFSDYELSLLQLAEKKEGTWLRYFVYSLRETGEENGGIEEKHRPRKYNGPPLSRAK